MDYEKDVTKGEWLYCIAEDKYGFGTKHLYAVFQDGVFQYFHMFCKADNFDLRCKIEPVKDTNFERILKIYSNTVVLEKDIEMIMDEDFDHLPF